MKKMWKQKETRMEGNNEQRSYVNRKTNGNRITEKEKNSTYTEKKKERDRRKGSKEKMEGKLKVVLGQKRKKKE